MLGKGRGGTYRTDGGNLIGDDKGMSTRGKIGKQEVQRDGRDAREAIKRQDKECCDDEVLDLGFQKVVVLTILATLFCTYV
jgi:hypothetical protein